MKKFIGLIGALLLTVTLSSNVASANNGIGEYEKIMDEINEEFDLDLGIDLVDTSKLSLEEFEEMTTDFAKEQRELLDYIASTEEFDGSEIPSSKAPVTKTKTQDTWALPSQFSITATYTVDGQRVSNVRSAKINTKLAAILGNVFLTNISSPSYSVIDGGRTGTVKYTARVHFNSVAYSNATLYAEFYYSL